MFVQYTQTPLGVLKLTAQGDYLVACERVRGAEPANPNDVTALAAAQLAEYFAGTRKLFTVPLSPRGGAFRQSVWAALLKVGYGETIGYGQLAACVGSPKAARAVGGAVGKNPLLIFIPCHRVLRAGGHLGGFSAGLDAKEILLRREGIPWKP